MSDLGRGTGTIPMIDANGAEVENIGIEVSMVVVNQAKGGDLPDLPSPRPRMIGLIPLDLSLDHPQDRISVMWLPSGTFGDGSKPVPMPILEIINLGLPNLCVT